MGVLDGKVAIVTGSARGIGRATAELLGEHGAKVVINDLDADVAEQTASELAGETVVYGGDLTKRRARRARADRDRRVGQARHHRQQRGLHDRRADPQDGRRDVPADARHPHRRPVPRDPRAAPHLREPAKAEREEGGEVFRKIVNVSSISGTMGNAGQANYSAGKSAVVGLTKTLAKEWGQFKINVNAVAFGWIETRLTASKVDTNRWRSTGRRSSSASRTRCAGWPRCSSRSAAPARRRRPPAASSSSAPRGRTSSTARCSTSPAASSRA